MANPEPGLRLADPLQTLDKPGMLTPEENRVVLAGEVARLLGINSRNFPGAQPVSFVRKHLQELMRQDYYVCEKSDGIRYLLYLTNNDLTGGPAYYLIDRKNKYWFIEAASPETSRLHLPVAQSPDGFHVETLIDGELVMDDLGGGYKEPRFLVFDCLVLDGKPLMSRPLDKRLGYFQENVMKPYQKYCKMYPNRVAHHACKVEMKAMQFSYAIETMFRDILPNLKHGNDGIVFTCRTSEYKHGTDEHILKWKPVEDNTVDFRLALHFPTVDPDEDDIAEGVTKPYTDYDSVPDADLLVFMGNDGPTSYRFFAKLHLTEDEWETLKGLGDPIDNRIVECALDREGRWRLHRFRDDKSEGNFHRVVENVMESIDQAVSKEELLAAAKSIREQHKIRNSRPPQK
ncbi:mRNA capping enzyme, catalytic domain-containing protein [Coniochaeta sp. 2T2.1]|nr:mRNA capping enzyme, catalytic domain-containing protein [Coniochaeta sp. 2T2.1]